MSVNYLPVNREDMECRGWDQVDFVLVSGDAYVDHPSFGPAIISRVLEDAGYKVGIIPQPDWKKTEDFQRLGRPRLGFLVSAGNMDSMVNHYSVNKKYAKKTPIHPAAKWVYGRTGRRLSIAIKSGKPIRTFQSSLAV